MQLPQGQDLSDLPVKHLLEMLTSLQARLDLELREIRYRTGEMEDSLEAMLESFATERTISLDE